MTGKLLAAAVFCPLVPLLVVAQQPERVDLNVVHRIKTEESGHSAVMETMHFLTDRYGPRLTNSPEFRAAGDWAVKQLILEALKQRYKPIIE